MKTIFVVLIMLLVIGCEQKQVKHSVTLRQLQKSSSTTPYAHGSFFLVAGSYSQGVEYKEYIKMLVDMNGDIFFTTLSLKHVAFRIDSTITTPKLYYWSHREQQARRDMDDIGMFLSGAIIVCPEYLLPVQLKPIVIE